MNQSQTTSELRHRLDPDEEVRATYHAQLNRVYGYLLYRLGGRRAVAEELTQDVFVAYVAAVRNGQTISDPQGWLITVARNAMVGYLRKATQQPRVWLAPISTDELEITDAERSAIELLEALPVDQRTAMTLRYVDDLTVAAVAEVLDRSIAATESLLARARRSLKEKAS